MQTLPPRQCSRPRHTFTIGDHTLEVVDNYKYLGVHFHSSGNPAAYMTAALRNLDCSYARMRRQYCGMACGSNLQLQLRFLDVLSDFQRPFYGAELWDVHSSTGRQRMKFASRYVKHLKATVWATAQHSTKGCPLTPRSLSCWNWAGFLCLTAGCIPASAFGTSWLALPADDLYRDVLFDSALLHGIGFAKHMQQACNVLGSTLNRCILPGGGGEGLAAALAGHVHSCAAWTAQPSCSNGTNNRSSGWRPQPWTPAPAHPREPPPAKYWRWFRRSNSQRQVQERYNSSLLSLPASARKISLILRFRLGCLRQLPIVQGRHDNIPREQRFCRHCPFHVGDEKHLIFDCPAF